MMYEMKGKAPKITATVRPMADALASLYLSDSFENMTFREWMREAPSMSILIKRYFALKEAYELNPDYFIFAEYKNGHEKFVSEEILGEELFNTYSGGSFWNGKPEPERKPQPLDLALEAGMYGDTKLAEKILRGILKKEPDSDRAKFNLGLYEMMNGNMLQGHINLDAGRGEKVWGNPHNGSPFPIWQGQKDCTVLMEMEGGFGDMFHCIRYAKNIQEKGCRVIISGPQQIAGIMISVKGVEFFIAHEGVPFAYHDFWIPSMSVPVPLELEWQDVSGKSYIPRTAEQDGEGLIGLKWSGNPRYEHEQHRLFDKELMFDLVRTPKDEILPCVSLQRGDKDGIWNTGPDWMQTPDLKNWEDTRYQISRCSLIITSCTGIAHLASAMGIETWIVIPVLPYYTWAYSGERSPHYDSVTLFRQEKYGDWETPFKKIKERLKEHHLGGKLNG